MTDLKALTAANAARWSKATLTRSFSVAAKRLVAPKIHYEAISKATGVPWFIIAVIHEREASQSWSGSLAQGDPWDKVLGLGSTDPLLGWVSVTANLVISFYFAKRGFENVARIIKR